MDHGNGYIPIAGQVIGPKDRQTNPFKKGAVTGGHKNKKERRKRKQDRRDGVRDGVVVKLSFKYDRRKGVDRRMMASARKRPPESFGNGIIA